MKKLIFLVTILLAVLFSVPAFAADRYNDIINEVNAYVDQGKLPQFHKQLAKKEGYQVFYTKKVRTNKEYDGLASLAQTSETTLRSIIQTYENRTNNVWYDVLTNLDIDVEYLKPNEILGLYWDSKIDESYSYLYLIWTTEYTPSEFMTIKDMVINGEKKYQYDTNNPKIETRKWLQSDYYHISDANLSLYKTPIAGIDKNEEFGIGLRQKYMFMNLNIGLDKMMYAKDPDPKGEYDSKIDGGISFDLGKVPKKDGVKLFQMVTHAYKIIKDCEAQSHFDLGFGGYEHWVFFNTTITIDRIYRVDVSYTLTSDNKEWYQFWLNTKEENVTKSLTNDRSSNGFFNLGNYVGFKEGEFKSNKDKAKTYKYKLHLNYDDKAWDFFDWSGYVEADYKRVKNFKILRMNYVVDDKTYDVAIDMDTVDGSTLSIVDPGLIDSTSSASWKIKDKIGDVIDAIDTPISIAKTFFDNFKTIIIVTASVLAGVLILSIGLKVYIGVKDITKKKGD